MPSTGLLAQLQAAAAAFLTAEPTLGQPYFLPSAPAVVIPVFTEQVASLQQKINDGLMRTGLSILIRTVAGGAARNNVPDQLCFGDVSLVFMVGCTPNANPSGLDPSTVAEMIWWVMRKFKFNGVTPEHIRTQLLPAQIESQVHWGVEFRLADLKSATPPTR